MSVVGIDLGTTNTVVACVRSGKVHVLADEHRLRLLPSVVSFHPNGEVLVGAAAKARRIIDPRNTVYSHKRLIGRSWGSPEIGEAKSRFAFELKEGPGQGPLIRARGQDYTLPEISAFVLKRSRQIAETALGTPVERAVITVPAHFNELQRASTKVAGRVSGLEVLRILNEPTAAALAYGLGRTGNERVAVYDFGGGTFDCTLLDLNGNVFEVLATAGDSFLGGDDVDNLIAERMAETYLKAHRYDPRTDPLMLERLKTTAEDVKMVLSTAETHTVVLKEFGHGAAGSAINYTFTMTRRDLDHMITPLIDRSFKATQDALALARLSPTSFDKIILVGGSTRMPLVRKRVEAFFGQAPLDRVNPDEVVAIGAAIQAAALTEGARKRSIPAPPNVIGKPRALRGHASETNENTQTGTIERPQDPETLQGTPPRAVASNAPSFGVDPAWSPAPGGPATRPGPPPPSAGARTQANATQQVGSRKITSPGMAPNTQPVSARASAPTSPGGADNEDPSSASLPDLAVPTPFEWFPSSGQPSRGEPAARSGRTGSERSFGEQSTLTANVATNVAARGPVPSRPAAGVPASGADFGAIDEPPSLMSTPSASVPSFPSMNSGETEGRMPSPIGEPEPFASDDLPGGQVGAAGDRSLVSSASVARSASDPSVELGFGHVADLSLISTSSATAEVDGVTEARKKLLDEIEDETEANARSGAAPGVQPGLRRPSKLSAVPGASPFGIVDDAVDLPSVAQPIDLPSVVQPKGKRPEIRKPGQPGMTQSGGPSMLGKPPPLMAPQPFGPMEKIGSEGGPPSRTAAMPPPQTQLSMGQPPPDAPRPHARSVIKGAAARGVQRTGAMPVRGAQPMNTTAPLDPPPKQPLARTATSPQAAPPVPSLGASGTTAAFGPEPPAHAFGGSPPPPVQTAPMPPQPQTPQFGGFGAPPQQAPHGFHQPYPSIPPQPQYPSQPPYNQGPPLPGSQVPAFGTYPSASTDGPLDVNAMAAHSNPNTAVIPGGPQQGYPPPQQQVGFAAPVLVDVTPRGLVVETAGGYADTIIPRNAKIPCERTRRFATGRDMQTTVRVRVGQGEGSLFPQNTFLGEVELSGLRPAPRGEVVVAVTFEVDADGTLRVRARDVQTGQEARATLQLVGVADESSVVMMINRFAQQPVVGEQTRGPH